MLKYVLLLFVLMLTIFSITACGSRHRERDYNEALGHQFVSPKALAMLKSESFQLVGADSIMRQPLIEMTINHVTFSHDVKIDTPYYGHNEFQSAPGCVYIVVDVNVKNMQNREVDSRELLQQIKIDAYYNEESNTYRGTGDVVFLGFYETLKPRAAGEMYFLINCPEEVERSQQALFLICALQGKHYQYTVR